MSDVNRPALEKLVHDVEVHLDGPGITAQPHPSSPLPVPALGSFAPSLHESEAETAYAESERPPATPKTAAVDPVIRAVAFARRVYGVGPSSEKITEGNALDLALEGLALVPVLGAMGRSLQVDKVQKVVRVVAPAAKKLPHLKVLPGAAPQVAKGAGMGLTEGPTAETIAETNAMWAAVLDIEKIAAAHPQVKVSARTVKDALSLLDQLASDLQAFKTPWDVMPKLLEHVGQSRAALLAGNFTNTFFDITSYVHGIRTAHEYLLFRKNEVGTPLHLDPGVQHALIGLLKTAQKTLGEMKFTTERVAKAKK